MTIMKKTTKCEMLTIDTFLKFLQWIRESPRMGRSLVWDTPYYMRAIPFKSVQGGGKDFFLKFHDHGGSREIKFRDHGGLREIKFHDHGGYGWHPELNSGWL